MDELFCPTVPQQYKNRSLTDCTGQQDLELRNIASGQRGIKSVLDYMKNNCKKVKCRDMAGQKCEHMPKIPSTELLAKECKIVQENKCKTVSGTECSTTSKKECKLAKYDPCNKILIPGYLIDLFTF